MSDLIDELFKAKVLFQQRAILAALSVNPSNSTPLAYCDHCQERHEDGAVFCSICGDHHQPGSVPYQCETGDGV